MAKQASAQLSAPGSSASTPRSKTARSSDAELIRQVCRWFQASTRDLPWRRPLDQNDRSRLTILPRRDPYHSLIAEVMAQQTQIARVVEYFHRFLQAFPTVHDLAAAPEQSVLALWSGLGYYRRARNLHGAARQIVEHHGGTVPHAVAELRSLPGVGRYTAGAIASIVFNRPDPIVDGNVRRVFLRLRGQRLADAQADDWAWRQAEHLVELAAELEHPQPSSTETPPTGVSPALWNEGLMELGATVCTPANPKCGSCPVRRHCEAYRLELVDEIPIPKSKAKPTDVHVASVVIRDTKGRILLERRPDEGLWASMWQVPTFDEPIRPPQASAKVRTKKPIATSKGRRKPPSPARTWTSVELQTALHLPSPPDHRGDFTFTTSHRLVHIQVWMASADAAKSLTPRSKAWLELRQARPTLAWFTRRQLAELPLASAQRRVIEFASD